MRSDLAECSAEGSKGSDENKIAAEVLGLIYHPLQIFRPPHD
jgi:hypothetical protein